MDLLSQYKQEHPEAFRTEKRPQMADAYGREYTGMIALVMRMSDGRIKDARQASVALFVISAIIVASTLIIFFLPGGVQNALPKNFEQIDQSQYANPK